MNLSERCQLKTHGVPPGRGQLGSSHEQLPRVMTRRSGCWIISLAVILLLCLQMYGERAVSSDYLEDCDVCLGYLCSE
jgi:hypothetical protein